MRTLVVNLKHFYQCRILWLIYLFIAVIVYAKIVLFRMFLYLPSDIPLYIYLDHYQLLAKGLLSFYIPLSISIGLMAGLLVLGVMTKPFAYCLPGYIKTIRQLLFLLGLVVSFLGTVIFLAYLFRANPWISSWQSVVLACPVFCIFLILFWVAAGLCFVNRIIVFFTVPTLLVIFFIPLFFIPDTVFEFIFIKYPVIITGLGVLVGMSAWFLLGYDGITRFYYGAKWLGIFSSLNRQKSQIYYQDKTTNKKIDRITSLINQKLEGFFLKRIQRNGFFGKGGYIWGYIYIQLSKIVSSWIGAIVTLSLLIYLFFCGLEEGSAAIPTVFFLLLFTVDIDLPVFSNMLICGGRRERFFTTTAAIIAYVIFVTVFVTICTGLSIFLASIIFNIDLLERARSFYTTNLCILLFLIPMVFTGGVIFHRKPLFKLLLYIPLFFILFEVEMLTNDELGADSPLMEGIMTVIDPHYLVMGLLVVLTVICWFSFFAVLYYVCMKRPLVGQSESNWIGMRKI